KSTGIERVVIDQLVCWRLRGPAGELLLAEQGAQILSYQEWEQPPLIWLSEQAESRQGQSLRGGVPVCWPWFGALKRNPPAVQAMHDGSAAPGAHGVVRTRDWQLEDLEDAGDEVHMSLSLE